MMFSTLIIRKSVENPALKLRLKIYKTNIIINDIAIIYNHIFLIVVIFHNISILLYFNQINVAETVLLLKNIINANPNIWTRVNFV